MLATHFTVTIFPCPKSDLQQIKCLPEENKRKRAELLAKDVSAFNFFSRCKKMAIKVGKKSNK